MLLAQSNAAQQHLHLQAKLPFARALLALLAFLLSGGAFCSAGSALLWYHNTKENLHSGPADDDLIAAAKLCAAGLARHLLGAESDTIQKGAIQTAQIAEARDTIRPKYCRMLARHIRVRDLHLLQQSHVNAADSLRIADDSASFISDLPHCAFEGAIDNLQNQQNRKPKRFDGALLPAGALLHGETRGQLCVHARLLLQPRTFEFLAIANCMRPFARVTGVCHVHMKLFCAHAVDE
jgi:hypothetical protein